MGLQALHPEAHAPHLPPFLCLWAWLL